MVLPRIELGSQESESCVITNYTIEPLQIFIYFYMIFLKLSVRELNPGHLRNLCDKLHTHTTHNCINLIPQMTGRDTNHCTNREMSHGPESNQRPREFHLEIIFSTIPRSTN